MGFGLCRGLCATAVEPIAFIPASKHALQDDGTAAGLIKAAVTAKPYSNDKSAFAFEGKTSRELEIAAIKHVEQQRIGTLECDARFKISAVDEAAEKLLGYNEKELIGKPIICLMSPLVGRIHHGLFSRIRNATPAQLEAMRDKLKISMSNSREFCLLSKSNEPVVCGTSIDLHLDRTSTVVFEQSDTKILHNVPLGFDQYINASPGLYVEDYKDVICVMMDIAGSTQFASRVEPKTMAELMHKVYMSVNDMVLREVFPFAYIHEIVGDSILLIVNAGFMAKFNSESAIIAIHAASQMQIALDSMLKEYSPDMYARVGISMGDVCAGVMDGRSFRVFGDTVHLSQRLEAICPRSHIACQSTVYKLLGKQMSVRPSSKQLQADLKGFGMVNYDVIPSASSAKCLHRHLCEIRQSMAFTAADQSAILERLGSKSESSSSSSGEEDG